MDQAALNKILNDQRKWMESVLEKNQTWFEGHLATGITGHEKNSTIPVFRQFDRKADKWETYFFQLSQHFEANSVKDDNAKRAHFLAGCGSELNEILVKLCETEDVSTFSFKDLTSKLTHFFKSRLHILAARYKLLGTKMQQGQSYSEWIAELKGITRDCSFVCTNEVCKRSYADVIIRDVITFNTPHENVRKKAMEKKNPTLEELEDIVNMYESTEKAISVLKGADFQSSLPEPPEVNQVGNKTLNPSKCKSFNFSNRKSCPGCGISHNRNQCFHAESICNYCERQGHIESVCLSRKQGTGTSRIKFSYNSKNRVDNRNRSLAQNQSKSVDSANHFDRSSGPAAHTVYSVETRQAQGAEKANKSEDNPFLAHVAMEQIPAAQMRSWPERKGQRFMLNLEINETSMEFQVDTGATVSLIGLFGYRQLGSPPCSPAAKLLKVYGGNELSVLGTIRVNVRWNEINLNLPLLVVNSDMGNNILGLDWFDALRFHIGPSVKQSSVLRSGGSQEDLVSEAANLIQRHATIFKDELGLCNTYVAHFDLKPNAQPKYFKPRPIPFSQMAAVKAEIERLISSGILKELHTSQWAAPIVVVTKQNGALRICGDFKVTINPQLNVDRYPIPRIEELFHKLQGGQFFTKIDLSEAYLQIPLDNEAKKLAVINTPFGLYQYERLPFGVASAPGIFQRYMEQLIMGLPYCGIYLDDLIITGRDNIEHLHNLEEVCKRLEENGLRCKRDKCQFAVAEIEYLGHIINSKGIRPSGSRVKAIEHLPRPTNLKELEAFIGKINYYNRYIQNFSQLAAPLNRLRAKNVNFVWADEQERAFSQLKQAIIKHTHLVHFREDCNIMLATDASSHGIGAVISHIYSDGSEQPIAFASKSLTDSQKNYSQIEKEALSIIFGVKKFHQYLYGRQFELVTDHKPLTAIFSPNKQLPEMTIQRLQRWAITLMSYTYTIRYRPTDRHGNADALSRLPMGPDKDFDDKEESCLEVEQIYISLLNEFPVNAKLVAEHTLQDQHLRKISEFVKKGWPEKLGCEYIELLPYFRRRLSLNVSTNVLLLQTDQPRVVVPKTLQARVLQMLHQGHWGITRMKQLARRYCWWPRIDQHIEEAVATCIVCQSQANHPPREYTSWPTPVSAWSRIHVDYAGPFLSKMWLIVVDAFSKFPFVVKMSSSTSEATINALQTIFAIEGLPQTIVSDNGTPFISHEFQDFCHRNSINHLTSAPFHPASNGEAERTVRTFKTALIKNLETCANNEMALLMYLSTYRSTPDSSGKSPAEYLHGRPHRTLLSAMKPSDRRFEETATKQTKFKVGQPIIARQYMKKNKWIDGTVIKPQGRRMYLIDTGTGTLRRHQNQLRKRTVTSPIGNHPGYEDSVVAGQNQHRQKEQASRTDVPCNRFSGSPPSCSAHGKEFSTRLEGSPRSEAPQSYVPISQEDTVATPEPQLDMESPPREPYVTSEEQILGEVPSTARRSKRPRFPPARFSP